MFTLLRYANKENKKNTSESGFVFLLNEYICIEQENKYGKLFRKIVPSISMFVWVIKNNNF